MPNPRRLIVPLVATLLVVACDRRTDVAPVPSPVTSPVGTADAGAVRPDGFDLVRARVTASDGSVCELCVWLAASAEQRRRGLMSVTDLGGADAMAFRYDAPHTGSFWMKDTVLPLSIAFFGADGGYLDAFEMAPCTTDPCPTYPTPADFVVAVETVSGRLAELGIAAGSTLELLDLPCAR
jgi:uncharacterized membrane protein (UPF0127 family)